MPGISVVALTGFNQTTGNPVANLPGASVLVEGRTNFPNNPNVLLQGSIMRPALSRFGNSHWRTAKFRQSNRSNSSGNHHP